MPPSRLRRTASSSQRRHRHRTRANTTSREGTRPDRVRSPCQPVPRRMPTNAPRPRRSRTHRHASRPEVGIDHHRPARPERRAATAADATISVVPMTPISGRITVRQAASGFRTDDSPVPEVHEMCAPVRSADVGSDPGRNRRHIELAGCGADHEVFGVVDGVEEVASVEEAEDARSRPTRGACCHPPGSGCGPVSAAAPRLCPRRWGTRHRRRR